MTAIRSSFHYPLLIWFATVVISPFVLFLFLVLCNHGSLWEISKGASLVFIIMAGAAVITLPSFFVFWFAYARIRALPISIVQQKAWLICIGIGLIIVTILICGGDFMHLRSITDWFWPGSYTFVMVSAIMLTKIKSTGC